MNPDNFELQNLTKNFEYTKIANEINNCDDINELKNIAKCFCKLYYKQQETMQIIGVPNGN